jgi:hypothetical protein
MESTVTTASVRAARRRIAIEIALAALAVVGLMMFAPPARADNVDTLVGQLGDSSDKIRLAAVLNLTKLGDPRAVAPLIGVLNNDPQKNVRGAAAKGLGTLVTASVTGKVRSDAVAALNNALNHPAPFVQAQAQAALNLINSTSTTPAGPPSGKPGGVYVNIGPMASKTGNAGVDAKIRALMEKTALKTVGKAGNMPTTWPGGVPTAAALTSKNVQGFYIDGTTNQLTVQISGSNATVSCKVSMLLADFPNKSIFGFLNGGAKVQGSSSQGDIDLARDDCVAAVVEDLISKKIVPTIKDKAGLSGSGSGPSSSKGGTP